MSVNDDYFPDAEHLALALDAGRIGMWSWDAITDVVIWDDGMRAQFGLERSTPIGSFETYIELLHPDDREPAIAAISGARESGEPFVFEHRAMWDDGSVHWIEGRGRSVFDDAGKFVGMVGVGLDIDERKRLEEFQREADALRANLEILKQLENAQRLARIGSWGRNLETDEVEFSVEMRRQLGVDGSTSGDELAALWAERIHPDDHMRLEEAQARALEEEHPYTIEHRLIVHGQTRHFVQRGELVRAEDGTIIGLRGTSQDITARKRAEEALRATRGLLERERHAVQVLHEALVHPTFPEVDGFDVSAEYLAAETTANVGGDWYDAFVLPDGRLMLAVGDVAGHGIAAARLMAKLRHATRAYAALDSNLMSVLGHLDEFLSHFRNAEEFATVQLAILDPKDGTLDLVSAGHPSPVLLCADHANFIELDGSRALGLSAIPLRGKPSRFVLDPGAALLFYTDGLVERRADGSGGGERHLTALSLATTGARAADVCTSAITACLSGVSREDDVCVLAVVRAD